jgi:chemotaxis protein histidine kinase CheA
MSDEIVREFLVEGNENLDTLDRELVQLEKDPSNRATLANVFRTIHTIKGTCGFLGFTKLESVAHVGERPEVRVATGKSAEGRVTLRAYHEGGQVNIEIGDDGAGLDQEKIKRKALERGLLTAEKLAQMTEREVLNLIFLPGFSTADKITNVSGRGVGMDVVKPT